MKIKDFSEKDSNFSYKEEVRIIVWKLSRIKGQDTPVKEIVDIVEILPEHVEHWITRFKDEFGSRTDIEISHEWVQGERLTPHVPREKDPTYIVKEIHSQFHVISPDNDFVCQALTEFSAQIIVDSLNRSHTHDVNWEFANDKRNA